MDFGFGFGFDLDFDFDFLPLAAWEGIGPVPAVDPIAGFAVAAPAVVAAVVAALCVGFCFLGLPAACEGTSAGPMGLPLLLLLLPAPLARSEASPGGGVTIAAISTAIAKRRIDAVTIQC